MIINLRFLVDSSICVVKLYELNWKIKNKCYLIEKFDWNLFQPTLFNENVLHFFYYNVRQWITKIFNTHSEAT